eukprot:CAMPEP_0201483090 /NCGR_PEP_ID=MMETSP0151_2-20130828/7321_1 /ASSEMBLY_ACC=CAM_ASM_000257 /TAXON_ID=200890 /ORGANISM="Paramoeba atlantica, Strain 621/1 / CCAP 1560/9" /LENGTH=356 /DNA_ID=CAMNT_0047866067 /DNA_START=54 /DNA_END=1121 /DNA_ORIENTATION=+
MDQIADKYKEWVPTKENLTPDELHYTRLALTLRDKVEPPIYSNFRVQAVITYKPLSSHLTQKEKAFLFNPISSHQNKLFQNSLQQQEEEKENVKKKEKEEGESYLSGANGETGNIAGAICAERAAFLKFREIPALVTKVFIVSDSDVFITPGTLCREFMRDYADASTPVIMASASGDCNVTALETLFPHPYAYICLTSSEITRIGPSLVKAFGKPEGDWAKLYDEAIKIAPYDCQDKLYPLRLSAAIEFSDGTICSTNQTKALEYGSTLDPVSKLFYAIDHKVREGHHPTRLLQVDEFGVLHAPFAQARALLAEGGGNQLCGAQSGADKGKNPFAKMKILVHSVQKGEVVETSVSE